MSGVFGASHLFFSGQSEFYDFELTNSLRFDDSSSPYLEKTLSSGNTQTYSISVWFKRADITSTQVIFHAFDGSSTYRGQLSIDSNQRLYFEVGGSQRYRLRPSRLFRDTSSWYNVVAVSDLSNTTDADKLRIYVNGVRETVFTSSDLPTVENYTGGLLNSNLAHQISGLQDHSAEFDGYLAEFNFIDGQALDASSFGELKSGVWIPKNTSGLTFGTNGFRLEFKQIGDGSSTASALTKGADTSGQDNHFNDHNLNAFDVMPDCPTNNFPTLNPQIGKALTTHVDPRHGNLEVDTSGGGRGTTFSTMAMPTGAGQKFYAEYRYRADSGHMRVGIISVDQANEYLETNNFDSPTTDNVSYTSVTGKIAVNGSQVEVVATYTAGDVIGMAVDLENGTIQFSKNGSNVGSAVSQSFISSNEMLFAAGDSSTSDDIRYSANFGQDSTFAGDETAATNADTNGIGAFHSAVPSGFKALCAKNLPEPSITPLNDDIPEDYFDMLTWVGTQSSQSITGLQFTPDWVWLKNRDHTDWNNLMDTVRSNSSRVASNETNAEDDGSGIITSFDSNGFSVGSNSNSNRSGDNFIAWNWVAGGTPTATNSAGAGNVPTSGSVMIDGVASTANLAGTIPVTKLSANTEAGFSIIKYSGTGSSMTFGHGLGVAPDFLIIKRLTASDDWIIYPLKASGNTTGFLRFDSTTGGSDSVLESVTSTVIGLGSSGARNNAGDDYICYAFSEKAGYSKVGKYVGNSNSDGQYIYTGFRPAFLLNKVSGGGTGHWHIYDSKRDPNNEVDKYLYASVENAEGTSAEIDFYSNGFKWRGASSGSTHQHNVSGDTYIYIAFAEMPFKYANAR